MSFLESFRQGVKVFASDVGDGFFLITHSGLALLGLGVFCAMVLFSTQADLRSAAEIELIDWLQNRHDFDLGFENNADAVDRATAADPRDLPPDQANIAMWLSRKYRVAPEPISALVAEAYEIGPPKKIDPTLILAVMAVESSFNPFAQSSMGAQGLMQVRTDVHTLKYDNFGGEFAAFDPIANLRVGVAVLKEAIDRNGGIEPGLRQYVGAGNSGEDGGYVLKVLAEQQRLKDIASGKQVSTVSSKTPAENGLVDLWDKAKILSPFNPADDKP
jgi:soluble lytic murein transglycosylase-like protein